MNPFETTRSAARDAFRHLREVTGQESDPALAYYNQLAEPDFEAITQKYGPQATVDYIKTMEAKRLKGR